MTRRRLDQLPPIPTPPNWIGGIGPGRRWRDLGAYLDWAADVWLAQPFAVRVAKVRAWGAKWRREATRTRTRS
jgi:hypothetical protein